MHAFHEDSGSASYPALPAQDMMLSVFAAIALITPPVLNPAPERLASLFI
jgi:hypothetical protein